MTYTEQDRRGAALGLLVGLAALVAAFSSAIGVDFMTGLDVFTRCLGCVACLVAVGVIRKHEPWFGLPIFLPAFLSLLAVAIFPALDYWSAHHTFGFRVSDEAWFATIWFKLALFLTPLIYYAVKIPRFVRGW